MSCLRNRRGVTFGSRRWFLCVLAAVLGPLLLVPSVAAADSRAVPPNTPIASNPQPGVGHAHSAPFQWYKVHLDKGDSLAATLTVTSEPGDDVYLTLYLPWTTHQTQNTKVTEAAPFVYTATHTGYYLFCVFSFDAYSTAYTITWQRTAGVTHALTYKAGTGGTIAGEADQTVIDGGDGTAVTATPKTGYHFVRWSDGSKEAKRTDIGMTQDLTVTAIFARNVVATRLSIASNPRTARVRQAVSFYGAILPNQPNGTPILLYAKAPGSKTWVKIATCRTHASKRWANTFRPNKKGTWYFQARFAGRTGFAKSTSVIWKLPVK